MERKRVLYIDAVSGSAIGGSERSLLYLLKTIDREMFEPLYLSLVEDEGYCKMLEGIGVETCKIPMDKRLLSVRTEDIRPNPIFVIKNALRLIPLAIKIADFLRKNRIDLLHTNSRKAHVVGILAAKLASVPIVCHIRGGGPIAWPVRRLFLCADRLICVCSEIKSHSFKERKKAVVIHNGIDPSEFDPATISEGSIRREFNMKEDEKLIGMIGHLFPFKGHSTFLDAARLILDQRSDVRFIVVGGKGGEFHNWREDLARLKAQAERLRISDRVIFAGVRKDIKEILKALDIFVFASWSTKELTEGMPRVVLEAMCMEKAVVATRTGGTVDLIEDRKSGILIPERDPEALSCAVIELLDDGAKRRELAKNARRRIIENFSIREITKKVEAIYYEVL